MLGFYSRLAIRPLNLQALVKWQRLFIICAAMSRSHQRSRTKRGMYKYKGQLPHHSGIEMKTYLRNLIRCLRGRPSLNEQALMRRMTVIASDDDKRICQQVAPYSMTNELRIQALLDAVDYVVKRDIPGAFAECGVWRGGSVLAMVLKLQQMGVRDRDIYLYDTFEGMTEPTAEDTSAFEATAIDTWQKAQIEGVRAWDNLFKAELFTETTVRQLLIDSGYPEDRLHFIKGRVEDTIPAEAPTDIALLRLDTDWYESTRHELIQLYPRLREGGVLIIDDYGHWEGCRKAVDEYFSSDAATLPLLNRIDYTARIAIKN